jgi:hypothetical protein
LAIDFAAARAKRQYDARHRPLEFGEGEEVYLRLHKGYHLPGNPSRKLSQQRTGPFVVKRRVGRLAYELDLPANMGIHPVISVAHLAPTPDGKDPFDRDAPPPGPVCESQSSASESSNPEPGEDYEVEAVVKHRPGRGGKYSYLIKWKGYANHHNVWKTAQQLRHSQKLIDEYWERQQEPAPAPVPAPEGSPAEAVPTAPERKRGRPRKSPAVEAAVAVLKTSTVEEMPVVKEGLRRSGRLRK